jgi:hypothetical protein
VNGGCKFFDEMEETELFFIIFSEDVEETCFDLCFVGEVFRFGDDVDELVDDLFGDLLEFDFDFIVVEVKIFEFDSFEYTIEDLEEP